MLFCKRFTGRTQTIMITDNMNDFIKILRLTFDDFFFTSICSGVRLSFNGVPTLHVNKRYNKEDIIFKIDKLANILTMLGQKQWGKHGPEQFILFWLIF